jgi:hypothetical protein
MLFRKAFLSVAVLAGGLVVAAASMAPAADPPGPAPTSCAVPGFFAAQVVGAPTFVSCTDSSTGQCTEITYTVTTTDFQSTDHALALEGLGLAYVKNDAGVPCGSSCAIFPACEGDNLTGIGKYACHEQAVRVNANASKSTTFTIGLVGQRSASPTSIGYKKGRSAATCRILGIGLESAGNPLATFTEEVTETLGGKCKVIARTNKHTGVTTVVEADNNPQECEVSGPFPVGSVTVQVNTDGTDDAGPIALSEGFTFLVGTGTCAYKQYYPNTGPIYRVCW